MKNSTVIKFVAGGGKTSYSLKMMQQRPNGLYLAFTNTVVQDIRSMGCLSLTIDSLFWTYILPKLQGLVPIIADGAKIEKNVSDNYAAQNARKLSFNTDGDIYNGARKLIVNFDTKNEDLYLLKEFANSKALKYIFDPKKLRITDEQMDGIAKYLLAVYNKEIVHIIKNRFSFVIIDEAQDLGGFREEFAQILYESDVELILLGDDNQNIMPRSGGWFGSLRPDEKRTQTYRCGEGLCRWVREELNIEIYSEQEGGGYVAVSYDELNNFCDSNSHVLLYKAKNGNTIKNFINNWRGESMTIGTAKGQTINKNIILIGSSMSKKNIYTALTRTTGSVYSTIQKVND